MDTSDPQDLLTSYLSEPMQDGRTADEISLGLENNNKFQILEEIGLYISIGSKMDQKLQLICHFCLTTFKASTSYNLANYFKIPCSR